MSTATNTPLPKAKQQKERRIENRLVKGVKAMGGHCLKLEVKGNAGWPDRLCIVPGGIVGFAELKCATGRLSKIQDERVKWLIDEGHVIGALFTVKEVDLFLSYLKVAQIGKKFAELRRLKENPDGY